MTEEVTEEPKLKAVRKKKYAADKAVTSALKDALDSCTNDSWKQYAIILFDKDDNSVYTDSAFENDKDFLDCLEIIKLRHFAVIEEEVDDV